jgi:hypothetical protein
MGYMGYVGYMGYIHQKQEVFLGFVCELGP